MNETREVRLLPNGFEIERRHYMMDKSAVTHFFIRRHGEEAGEWLLVPAWEAVWALARKPVQ